MQKFFAGRGQKLFSYREYFWNIWQAGKYK